MVFGLHSYNLFLHFFFLRCGGCTEAVVNVKQNKTSLLKFEHAFECYLNYFSLLEMLNGDVIRRSRLVPVLFIWILWKTAWGDAAWRGVAWRRFSSPVWMMAVKDGFCYFLIQKKFQLNTHFYVQKQVWCLGHFESTLARPRGLMREDSRPVHGRPLKSVTVVILDTEAVSNRLVCVRGESFPETAEIEEKCN